ncbi:carboxymuconolactone decarboxylase family protein [Bowmanella dokdonensis]|uniref:Carboxymuconolactone decarboxylase family protein n=1 Tax=Bowmanella dokdonensis TaxID=751969 RepID=A0A939DPJ0_9ALTE|nr:carboxymuconolactone decarboxylase family protein [Bowmanella dokdonensis]MBN7826593.1 carboxymuconolactone decarboxylase family protein [Bowmanella dokdonensis]
MSIRVNYSEASPGALKAMLGLEKHVSGIADKPDGLPLTLLELVRFRVSQLNSCAFCLDMHSKDALAKGEKGQRLYLLNAWREAPFYTAQEQAALEWAESLTLMATKGIPDTLFERVKPHFSDQQLTDLTLAIVAINGWNRFAVGLGADIGSYQPGQFD